MKYKTKRKVQKTLSVIGWSITGSILITATVVSCYVWFIELSQAGVL